MKSIGLISAACAAAAVVTLTVWAVAQNKPTTAPAAAPATRPAGGVTVKQVSGSAQRLAGEQWVALAVGDSLDELTVIRTGFGSKVELEFPDGSRVVVDRATKMGIRDIRTGGKDQTAVGLKYGSITATVEHARGANNFLVQTPVATAAVRGTIGTVGFTGDFGMGMQGQTGLWSLQMGGQTLMVSGTEQSGGGPADDGLTRYVDLLVAQNAAFLGDLYGGLTPEEIRFLLLHGDGRGGIGFIPGGWMPNLIGPISGPDNNNDNNNGPIGGGTQYGNNYTSW